MSLDSAQITTISPEQLEELFKDVPGSTPSADTLAVGKENHDLFNNSKSLFKDIPEIDLDELEKDDKKKEPEAKVEDKTTDTTKVEDKKVDEKVAPVKEEKTEVKETPTEIKEALKNTVNYLITSGLWEDFDGREDLEFDEATYSQLAAAQQQAKVDELFSELLDSTGDYGKAIIAHIKNGGNPEDVIDVFKEQKQLQQIDTTSDEGKLELIGKYYSEVIGWKPERIRKHLTSLVEDTAELETEVSDIQEKYDEYYNEQLQQINQQQKLAKQQEQQKQELFKTNIKSILSKREDLTDKDRRFLEKSILDFNHKLDNGVRVNDFYVKFAQMQQNPNDYIDFVQFVMDKEAYKSKIQREEKTKAAVKTFNFVKGNGAVTKSSSQPTEKDDAKKGASIDFSSLLRKK